MAIPSKEQLAFFQRHKIPLSKVFDATGYSNAEYKTIMRELGMVVAIEVTPCAKAGHTIRTRAGHCAQCGTHNLAFLRRFEDSGDVYVATSESAGLTKIGTAQDAYERLNSLNYFGYGGTDDWMINFVHSCSLAGRVEFTAQQELNKYSEWREYVKQGNVVVCQELFRCEASLADEAIERAIKNVGATKS